MSRPSAPSLPSAEAAPKSAPRQAPVLYTEDLNHDQTYGMVRVVNPFRSN